MSTAWVTGGASGIGAAVSAALRARGHHVITFDIRQPCDVELDVADADGWARAVAAHPLPDIAFLNAGIATGADWDVLDVGAYQRARGVNIDGVVYGALHLLRPMIERGHGTVLCTASLAGLGPMPMDPVYGLTKHAVVGLVRALSARVANSPVTVAALCPGFIDTPILSDTGRAGLRAMGVPILAVADAAEHIADFLEHPVNGAEWVLWGHHAPFNHHVEPVVAHLIGNGDR
jgi:NAD(P)-dependent dehydrogenase (short-subunit alcohol dehydrogenase family)